MAVQKELEWLVAEYDRLHEAYLVLAEEWYEYMMARNEGRKPMERTQLLIKVRRRGPTELNAIWTFKRFFRTKDGWKSYSYEIRKGQGSKTPAKRIRMHAVGWEVEEALKYEERLARLREQQAALGKATRAFKRYLKLREADEK